MDNTVPTVAVLLATSKPKEHIKDQIESIKRQEQVRVKLYWGDYQSSNETKEAIRALLEDLEYTEYVIAKHGAAQNFLYLLTQTSEDYVAFSDQDDVWLPHKLISQVRSIANYHDLPCLVHSTATLLIDNSLHIQKSRCGDHSFASLATSNCCQGCTVMINSSAKQKIVSNIPSNIIWHDWWIAIVVSLTGIILSSNDPQVHYRIHDTNSIGIPNFSKKIRNYLTRPKGLLSYQITEAFRLFAEDSPHRDRFDLSLLRLTSSKWSVRLISNAVDRKIRRLTFREDLIRRLSWAIRQP